MSRQKASVRALVTAAITTPNLLAMAANAVTDAAAHALNTEPAQAAPDERASAAAEQVIAQPLWQPTS